jgi:hypothetical protein
VKTPTALLALLLACLPSSAQELKKAEKILREKYPFALPVKVKDGSRIAALRLLPAGHELFVVSVNKRLIALAGENESPGLKTERKVAECTNLHEDLSHKGPIRLGLVMRKSGGGRGTFIELEMSDWDSGLIYAIKPWAHDATKYVMPGVTKEPVAEAFEQEIAYSEEERRVEIADFDRLRRDKEEKRKNPEAGLKSLESFKAAQRKLKIDEGAEPKGDEEKEYREARIDIANRLSLRASEARARGDWFGYYRFATASAGRDGGMDPGPDGRPSVDAMNRKIAGLAADLKSKVRIQAASEATVALKEKRYLDCAVASKLAGQLGEGDAPQMLATAKKAAFSVAEMTKTEFDGWLGVLVSLPRFPAEPKNGELYRAEGKVEKAGPFTLVKSGDVSWVFEDTAGLKFDAGDTFTAIGIPENRKAKEGEPDPRPEELRGYPFVRLVLIR